MVKRYNKILRCLLLAIIILIFLYFLRRQEGFETGSAEKDCIYVSSRGILFSCDVHPKNPVSSAIITDLDLSAIEEGSTVYLQASAVKAISKQLLAAPPFVLVTGDCDEDVPNDIFTESEFQEFIESDKILHWFSQNSVGKHPKLTQIPIGLDYHTRASSDIWGPKTTPAKQEKELVSLKKKPFYQREPKAYANFHFSMSGKYGHDRTDAKNSIPADCVFYEPSRVTQSETFQHQIDYAFVVSPHGNGLDCHRTWEALVLGCIPIVKTSPLDPLYKDLPVLIVDSWSQVNRELLLATVKDYQNSQFNYDKLTLKYWVDMIQATATRPQHPSSWLPSS